MAQTVCVVLSGSDKARLETIVADRNQQQKHVERARVVLASAEGLPVQRVAALVNVSRPMVWRWQRRFAEEGVGGLLRDKTRKPGKPPIAAEKVAQVVAMTCAKPPGEATHWTGRAMAKAAGLSLRTVQRIWEGLSGISCLGPVSLIKPVPWQNVRRRGLRTGLWPWSTPGVA